jgi:hypothetical protein
MMDQKSPDFAASLIPFYVSADSAFPSAVCSVAMTLHAVFRQE